MKKLQVFTRLLNSLKELFKPVNSIYQDEAKQAEQIKFLQERTEFLRYFPVSPYFAQKVLVTANSRKREEFWLNLQLFPGPAAKFALFSLILVITLFLVPGNNGNTGSEETTTDAITIIYNNDASINEIKTDEQALQFALLY
ncbi:MAG TPA: hypothetical protein PLP19_18170 [bacterium]|nr:hypothetical protein [bacterium]HPN45423.1 hypothetical protein [bacterium]